MQTFSPTAKVLILLHSFGQLSLSVVLGGVLSSGVVVDVTAAASGCGGREGEWVRMWKREEGERLEGNCTYIQTLPLPPYPYSTCEVRFQYKTPLCWQSHNNHTRSSLTLPLRPREALPHTLTTRRLGDQCAVMLQILHTSLLYKSLPLYAGMKSQSPTMRLVTHTSFIPNSKTW